VHVKSLNTCALAVAPDAHAEVMEVSAKYSKGAGEGYSAKGYSAKGYSAKGYSSKDGGQGAGPSSNDSQPRVQHFSPLYFVGLDGTGNFSPVQVFLPQAQNLPSNPYSQP